MKLSKQEKEKLNSSPANLVRQSDWILMRQNSNTLYRVLSVEKNESMPKGWVRFYLHDDEHDRTFPFVVRENDQIYGVDRKLQADIAANRNAIAAESAGKKVAEQETFRGGLLLEARRLITGDRNMTYGTPTENFKNIARLLNIQFAHKLKDGEEFSSVDVSVMMIIVKLARLIAQPKMDNFLDIIGYAACGGECQKELNDLIQEIQQSQTEE